MTFNLSKKLMIGLVLIMIGNAQASPALQKIRAAYECAHYATWAKVGDDERLRLLKLGDDTLRANFDEYFKAMYSPVLKKYMDRINPFSVDYHIGYASGINAVNADTSMLSWLEAKRAGGVKVSSLGDAATALYYQGNCSALGV